MNCRITYHRPYEHLIKFMNCKIIPLPSRFLARVRDQQLDDLDQAVEISYANGGEPCRDVLRPAKVGEKIILASYCPFSLTSPYKEYGPIFILANNVKHKSDITMLSLTRLLKNDYLPDSFIIRAYSIQERIIDAKVTTKDTVHNDLIDLLSNPNAAFVLVRYAAYGCYALRIECNQNELSTSI